MIKMKRMASILLWGAPGIGKTTLALIIANELDRPFFTLSAINSGVKYVRNVIDQASKHDIFNQNKRPILFIDEIHRFSKSQQDSLLGAVEKGVITLIGATTENPSFEVIPALLSRCQTYVLNPLEPEHMKHLVDDAMVKDSIMAEAGIAIEEYEALMILGGGDARKLLNTLELVVLAARDAGIGAITDAFTRKVVKENPLMYDKKGEMHYDIISAFIKSIRGSDPNGAIYWLARMIEGGEDPKFIARRILISASEDIGNANPTALVIANNCFQAVATIGYPECRIVLAQAAVYLANSPKSNASYAAINKAQQIVRDTGNLPVPLHLRNAPTKLMKDLGYGKSYDYSHNHETNFSPQEYLPESLENTTLYEPGNNPKEAQFKALLASSWQGKYGY